MNAKMSAVISSTSMCYPDAGFGSMTLGILVEYVPMTRRSSAASKEQLRVEHREHFAHVSPLVNAARVDVVPTLLDACLLGWEWAAAA